MTNTFSERIKDLRTQQNLNQATFAKLIGTNQSTLSAYESGDRMPPYEILVSIAKSFDVSIDWLCGLSDKKNITPSITTYTDLIRIMLTLDEIKGLSIKCTAVTHSDTEQVFFDDYKTIDYSIDSKSIVEFYQEWKDISEIRKKNPSGEKLYSIWLADVLERYDKPFANDEQKPIEFLPFN